MEVLKKNHTHTQKDTMYTWKLVGLCIQMLGIRSNVTIVNLTQTMKKKENYNYDMYAMNDLIYTITRNDMKVMK